MAERDTAKYFLMHGNKIIKPGITGDLDRREREHQRNYPGSHLRKVGRRTTEEAAREWERAEEIKRGLR